jgi:hypothetical protein
MRLSVSKDSYNIKPSNFSMWPTGLQLDYPHYNNIVIIMGIQPLGQFGRNQSPVR